MLLGRILQVSFLKIPSCCKSSKMRLICDEKQETLHVIEVSKSCINGVVDACIYGVFDVVCFEVGW